MKFAFSTVACPQWDFETVAAKAKEYGYDGVEIRGSLTESILTGANIFLTDPAKVRNLFGRSGLEIACLASSIAMTGRKKHDARLREELRSFIDVAAAVGCRFVKVFDVAVRAGQNRSSAGMALGDWLLPMGDYAAAREVTIVVEGALSFRDAKEMWVILDRLSHPSICSCWDVFNAALIGESPQVSVPTLNSKIQYTHVKDAKLGPMGALYCRLGEGDVQVETFIHRLRGIGYEGWVSFEWDKAWLPNLAEPEEVLPDAVAKLREWAGIKADVEGKESDSEPAASNKKEPVAAQ